MALLVKYKLQLHRFYLLRFFSSREKKASHLSVCSIELLVQANEHNKAVGQHRSSYSTAQ